jgi:hypothetical protein
MESQPQLTPLRNGGHRYRHGGLAKAQFITSGILQQQSPQTTKWGYSWDNSLSA